MKIINSIKQFFGLSAAIAGTGLTQAVAAVARAGNPIGNAVIAAVTAAETTNDSGSTKKAAVLAAVIPVIMIELAKGDLKAVVTDVEQFAGMVIEEVVAQVKPSGVLAIALKLLTLLGIK